MFCTTDLWNLVAITTSQQQFCTVMRSLANRATEDLCAAVKSTLSVNIFNIAPGLNGHATDGDPASFHNYDSDEEAAIMFQASQNPQMPSAPAMRMSITTVKVTCILSLFGCGFIVCCVRCILAFWSWLCPGTEMSRCLVHTTRQQAARNLTQRGYEMVLFSD